MTEHPPFTDHWLDEVEGAQALAWVEEQNATARQRLVHGDFAEIEGTIREILDDDRKIPLVTERGGLLYNFWRDAEHERGLWRRTTWESYRSGEPQWEVLLDLDALAAAEETQWVWHGAQVLLPECRRALVALSPGGSDADVTREFDLESRQFVADGFTRPLAKGSLQWTDDTGETVLVTTDRGEDTLTDSGYPRTVAVWRRGQELPQAVEVAAVDATDMLIEVWHSRRPGYVRDVVTQMRDFYTMRTGFVPEGFAAYADPTQAPITWLEVPTEHEAVPVWDQLLVRTRAEWEVDGQTYPAGTLLAFELSEFLAGRGQATVLFAPTETAALEDWHATANLLLLTVLEDVVPRVEAHYRQEGQWLRRPVEIPGAGADQLSVSLAPVDADAKDEVWVTATGFLTPTTLALLQLSADGRVENWEVLRQAPTHFAADGMAARQLFATSLDGTRVPYFVITPPDFVADGSAPAVLYGYGGFEVSLTPSYLAATAATWVARGGVYAIANIRGGGEYGPTWHAAALKENRHRAYEDFAAVARDLVARGFTTHARLGAQGGSNGGLLMGNMLTQYPELFGAIVCQVPLLDMRRFNRLLAGASWMAEYGDPDDPAQWEFIAKFSPYHLFDPARTYPPILFTTSTKDDRVHPAHARTMAHQMLAADKDVTYYENIEGGHGGASTNAQAAFMGALEKQFFLTRL
ncbi:prolyl oligopeptidase family serine peptidase [Buchananella hordeovulneris]|uniref:prolyl oligopeptidase family serine peptidase n=1 Tax=Buchananella hordeovulneris TaxID=52770 RepID=UPI0026DC351D|nr:prolyl oligopeptidase family serine peptidase [Buchananella hordeovulneris]MDO5080232.1 prolyl oligopeptidase family serine peptidase [Buchananella hordeovulneris]